jgi:predicted RNase H-like nuclease
VAQCATSQVGTGCMNIAQTSRHGDRVAGVDGCPAGWIVVSYPLDRPDQATCGIYFTFKDLLDDDSLAAIAVDIPVGLPEMGEYGGRAADRAARSLLGERRSSVFSVPARAAVACTDYRIACETALANSDPPRKVSKQAFNLFPKIRELDALMTPGRQDWIVECHPEVVFWAINGRTPLDEPKKVKSRSYEPGLALRRRLLVTQGFDPGFLEDTGVPSRVAAPDDLLDACAAAWTAGRVAKSAAERLPETPPTDARGLSMEIVF